MEILNVLLDEERKNKTSRFSTVCKDVVGLIDERIGFIPGSVKDICDNRVEWPHEPMVDASMVGTISFSIEGNLIVCDGWAHQLYVFDRRGHIIKTLTHETFKHPGAVAVDYVSGNIAVLDCTVNQVVVFDRGYNFLFVFGGGILDNPQSIAIAESGDIVVSQRANVLGASTFLLAFAKDGTFLKKVVKANDNPSTYTVIAYHHGKIFAENGGAVQIFSYPELDFISNFKTETTREAGDIACDRDGNIVVAEPYGGAVSVYSPNGNLIMSVITSGHKPNGVAIDRDGGIVYIDVSTIGCRGEDFRIVKIT